MNSDDSAELTQLALDFDVQPGTDVYVASALTALEQTERSAISHRCEVIDQTIIEVTSAFSVPWKAHLPVVWSAPRPGDNRSCQEIYELNRDHLRRASGLILLGDHGDSLGAGQEFAWAVARRLPILVLLYGEEPLSRQIAGTPARMSVERFRADEELRAAITKRVREWAPAVEAIARSVPGQLIIASRATERLSGALAASADSLEAIAVAYDSHWHMNSPIVH